MKLTSPQMSRESLYKLALKNVTLQCVSSRQVFITVATCVYFTVEDLQDSLN